ncbi:sialate O-acetylesterase [Lepagella muris]|jgi:sialate O-acetylesterase|uniref:Sialate O-acetylesterase n=1 Tax=Lepagella muris TaxID=3032870 RepID=A0AC61RIU7_9BACT|nr:sialate O-acetylesterase [Lepagella muris]ROT08683.1 sialate O-acetylesterase [Muribaculaceae bacterium Isolate-037 (Harlan)]TGY77709.1 sialate O-acetylesterase [Lepagella muris]THG50652.1 sialate O-acetylesterase [Bacteroidales bacterium]TKC55925.1 sialate O-acetylesterase [Bacteroidales bacterium]
MKPSKIILPAFLALAFSSNAKIELPNIFTDNMVIQADTMAAIWGKATPGSTVTAEGSWGESASAKTGKDGKWRLTLKTPAPSFTPTEIKITDKSDNDTRTLGNVLAGEVWLASGQSNMEMPMRGFWHQPVEGAGEQVMFSRSLGKGIRFINVPKAASYEPQDNFNGSWMECTPSTTSEFSALGWYFATALRDIIDVPVGIISCAYGGSKVEGWLPAGIIAKYPDRNLEAEKNNPDMGEWERINVMYNAMLLPVAGYTVRGFLWNQGESNVGGHDYYPTRQTEMVHHWRDLWQNPSIPFYFVELPGWEYGGPDKTEAALFREAQHKGADTADGRYIVCTSDLVYPDEVNDIHARNKRPIGQRMAAAAATYSYGIPGIPHTYPTFKEMENHGEYALITFDNAWSGLSPNENIEGFEVAGEDRVFHPAKAEIDLSKLSVKVSSPDVKDIKSVRYCFKNFAIGKLHDNYGMPVVPFRTDNWDM